MYQGRASCLILFIRARPTRLTHSDLDVVPVGWVLQVVDGPHHIQRHVTDVVGVVFGLLWCPSNHHVGVANGFHLRRNQRRANWLQNGLYNKPIQGSILQTIPMSYPKYHSIL